MQMHKVNNPDPPMMANKRVGAIRHRLLEGAVIAHGGGLLIDVEGTNNTESGIESCVLNQLPNQVQYICTM